MAVKGAIGWWWAFVRDPLEICRREASGVNGQVVVTHVNDKGLDTCRISHLEAKLSSRWCTNVMIRRRLVFRITLRLLSCDVE